MKPAYTLAFKLGIPVIVQPEWTQYRKLWEKGEKIREKGRKIWEKEGWKLWDVRVDLMEKGWKLMNKGQKQYREVVIREFGLEYADRIDWSTGEVKPL